MILEKCLCSEISPTHKTRTIMPEFIGSILDACRIARVSKSKRRKETDVKAFISLSV